MKCHFMYLSSDRGVLRRIRNMRRRHVLFAWAILLFVGSGAMGQTSGTGAITGTIVDPSGAAIVGAVVGVTNTSTQLVRTLRSGSDGDYQVSLLPPGNYTVTVSAPGFRTKTITSIVVVVTETAVTNIALEVGATSSEIRVSGTPDLLQTTDTTLGRVVTAREMADLPLANRNFTQILALSPGVAVELPDAGQLGKNNQNVSSNGIRTSYNNFQFNGVDANNLSENSAAGFGPQVGLAIPAPDSLEEFKVQTGMYDASSGRSAGANVNIVGKSGGNSFHGDAWEFFRNTALNANAFFRNKNGQPRPVLDHNQFGFTFGGPIRKDRTFFFLSYQGTRERNGYSSFGASTVLLPPLTDDRSASALGAEFGGLSGQQGGVAVAADGSNINPVALKLLQFKLPNGNYLIPTPQTILGTGVGESSFSIPAVFAENQYSINLDHSITSKQEVSGRFFYSSDPLSAPFALSLGGSNLPGFGQSENDHNIMLVLSHTYALGSNFTNQASFGFVRFAGKRVIDAPVGNSDVGITPPTGLAPIPMIGVSGLFSLGTQQPLFREATDTFIYKDAVSYNLGRHDLKMGGQIERDQLNTELQTRALGQITFQTFPDFLLGMSAAQNGSNFSNVSSSQAVAGRFQKGERYINWSWYVQDDIKVSRSLTVNLGVRYEFYGPPSDNQGRLSNFDPALAVPNPPAGGTLTGLLVASNFPGIVPDGVTKLPGTSIWQKDYKDFAPRLGLAWRPFGISRVVVRAGYGIYYERNSAQYPLELVQNTPFTLTVSRSGVANMAATFQNPFNPALPPASAFPDFVPRLPTDSITIQSIDPNDFRSPYSQEYTLGVQTELRNDLVLDVAYVGSMSSRIPLGIGYNQPLIATPQNPVNGLTTTTVANVQSRRTYLGLSSGVAEWKPIQDGNYNSLQVGLTKRFSRGLQFQSSYTWSRALDLQSSQGAGLSALDASNLSGNQLFPDRAYGPADYNRTHRYVLSFVYDSPAFKDANRLLRGTLGGWTMAGILLLQSGSPFSVTDSRSGTIYGRSGFANCTGLPAETSGSVESRLNGFLNPAGFALPTPLFNGTDFGNCSRNFLNGPAQHNLDFSVAKSFPMPVIEASRLEFRTEFLNLTNTPNFGQPTAQFATPSTFGVITTTVSNPRIIQFALKYIF
ncbi:MAG TPA: carboxypeptidase-like regulatory domain-containing protein [Candidatus Acidoferrales bacterium]|nr:carboxypeptidase-like regulatory domain-containing protein [Candidatus Acidoferrales bacterium]